MILDEIEPAWQVFLQIITQAVLTATPRERPPLGLLVITKLTLGTLSMQSICLLCRSRLETDGYIQIRRAVKHIRLQISLLFMPRKGQKVKI